MSILSYLRFALKADADVDAFEKDMDEMLRLARKQPGFRWAEMARSMEDAVVYVVVSEWDEVDQVRAWEHHPDHEVVIHRWEDLYREPFEHRRFTPWIRPE